MKFPCPFSEEHSERKGGRMGRARDAGEEEFASPAVQFPVIPVSSRATARCPPRPRGDQPAPPAASHRITLPQKGFGPHSTPPHLLKQVFLRSQSYTLMGSLFPEHMGITF